MRRSKVFRKLLVVCLVAVLAIAVPLVSGCLPGKPAAPPAEPIKIGGLVPVTGPFAADGITFRDGMDMAIAEINEQGGLLGRPLELVVFDIEDMMAEKLAAAGVRLVEQEKVDLLITGYAGMGPDVEYLGKYDVPYLHFDGSILTVEMFREDPNKWNVFMMGDVEEPYGRKTFEVVTQLPYEFPNNKAAVIAGDFEWDRLYTQGFKNAAIQAGWDVVVDEVTPYGTREWGPLLSKIKAEDPAIIHFEILDPADAVTFFRQWAEAPTNSLIQYGYVLAIPSFIETMGAEANGALGITTNAPLPTPQGEAWKDRFRTRFGKEPQSISGTVYDGIMAWAEAVKRVGNVTDYRAVCQALEDYPYEGVIGTFDFDEDHKIPAGPTMPMHYYQVQNGKLVLLYTDITPVPGTSFETPPWLD